MTNRIDAKLHRLVTQSELATQCKPMTEGLRFARPDFVQPMKVLRIAQLVFEMYCLPQPHCSQQGAPFATACLHACRPHSDFGGSQYGETDDQSLDTHHQYVHVHVGFCLRPIRSLLQLTSRLRSGRNTKSGWGHKHELSTCSGGGGSLFALKTLSIEHKS